MSPSTIIALILLAIPAHASVVEYDLPSRTLPSQYLSPAPIFQLTEGVYRTGQRSACAYQLVPDSERGSLLLQAVTPSGQATCSDFDSIIGADNGDAELKTFDLGPQGAYEFSTSGGDLSELTIRALTTDSFEVSGRSRVLIFSRLLGQ